MELCTAPLCWLHPNAAAIGLDDSSTNRKTKPHAFRFRAHERLEELGCDVRRYARPGVSHRHANKSRLIGRRPDREKTAGRRDVGDTYGHAIVEQVEYLADQDAGIEGDRLAGFDHHVAVGRCAHLSQKGDQIVELIIGAREMVAAAQIDPFDLVAEGTQHWPPRVPENGKTTERER